MIHLCYSFLIRADYSKYLQRMAEPREDNEEVRERSQQVNTTDENHPP